MKRDKSYRDWLVAAVAAEYFSRLGTALGSESPSEELTAYTFHETWGELIYDLTFAADELHKAYQRAQRRDKDIEIDSYITVEKFVSLLLLDSTNLGHFSYRSDLKDFAQQAITAQ